MFQTLQTNLAQIRPATWDAIHRDVIDAALAHQIDPGERVRIDTTPVPTKIHAPSDSTLLADGVRVLSRLCKQARRQIGFRDFHVRTRVAKRRMVAIQYTKPRDTAQRTQLYQELLAVTQQMVEAAEHALVQCLSVQSVQPTPRLDRLVADLTQMLDLVTRVITQTERRVLRKESVPATEKVVSLFESHTDVLVKDRRDTLYGHKLVLTEGTSRLILDYAVLAGNPNDTTQALPPLQRLDTQHHLVPTQVAYDGGFTSAENLAAIQAHGVADVCFTKARGLAADKMVPDARTYRALRRFRAGIESAISRLKRVFGLACCPWKGHTGFLRYVHTSILTANLLTLAHHLRA